MQYLLQHHVKALNIRPALLIVIKTGQCGVNIISGELMFMRKISSQAYTRHPTAVSLPYDSNLASQKMLSQEIFVFLMLLGDAMTR